MSAAPDPVASEASKTLESLFEERAITGGQIAIVALVLTVLIIDGLDVQLLAIVAPKITAEFGTTPAGFSLALTAALIGMAIANFLGGRLGDKIGKREVLVASTFLFGICTVLIAFVREFQWLVLLRFLSGIGFGAAVPNGLAYCAEWLAPRARAKAMAILSPAVPIGGVIGAAGTLAILPIWGWRGCFVVAGGLSLAIGLVMGLWLPGSPAVSIRKGRLQRLRRDLQRIIGNVEIRSSGDVAVQRHDIPPNLFSSNLQRLNLGSSLGLLCAGMVSYGMIGWSPTILVGAGLDISLAISSVFFFNLFAVSGALLVVWPISLLGTRMTMLVLGALCGAIMLAILLIFLFRGSISLQELGWWIVALTGISGAILGGITSSLYAIMASGYPTEARASGMGLGLMAGRLGGILIWGAGGSLIAISGPDLTLFYSSLVLAALMTCLSAMVINPHLPRR